MMRNAIALSPRGIVIISSTRISALDLPTRRPLSRIGCEVMVFCAIARDLANRSRQSS